MDNGYWTKFEVCRVKPTKQVPHGIRYSLSLPDRNNTRILGFDNAHAYKLKKKKYGASKVTWDQKHKMQRIYHHEFESASQLIEDFWKVVEEIL
jgi:hypothetical protein